MLNQYSALDSKSITSIEEVEKALEQLTREEEEVTERLAWTIGNRHHLEAKLSNLAHLVPTLQLVAADAKKLGSTIAFTNQLANGVSAKVRQLDLAKSRVSEVQKSVGDLLDLEGCAGGVASALADEDYEQAAAHINRFLSMDEAVLRHSANAANEGQNMDTWFERLRTAEKKLRIIISDNFDQAVKSEDHASIERFFKLFPLVNEHENGLQKFSQYLCTKVHKKNEKNLQNALQMKPSDKRAHIIWADSLTLLFEDIARTVEVNQPIIETYYKPGYLNITLKSLQNQCDIEASKLITEMKKQRNLNAIISAVEMISRPGSSSMKDNSSVIPESKNLDTLLGELTLMSARAELYLRFLKRRVTADYEASITDKEERDNQVKNFDLFLSRSQLACDLAIVIGSYSLLEKHYLNESFKKAVAMDSLETSQLTSSLVDDSFYIIKKCVRRAIASNNVDGVCVMLNHSVDLLETQLANRFHQSLRKGFPVQGYTDFSQAYSALQFSSRKSNMSNELEESRQNFLTALNNASTSILHVGNLQKSLAESISVAFGDLSSASKGKIDSCLVDLANTSKRLQTVVDFGLSQLQATAIKPKLKPWIDNLACVSHDITEDQFASYEANDPFSENLMVQLDGLLGSFSGLLTPENQKTLIGALVHEVSIQIEKTLFKMTFNRLGGLQLDREIRALSAYLSRVSEWSVREQLMRLTQIATLLNLEKLSEVSEYSGNANWRLTPSETKRVLQLRVDLNFEEIQKLRA